MPYDPRRIQIFSRVTSNWHTTTELSKLLFKSAHRVPITAADDASTTAPLVNRVPDQTWSNLSLIANMPVVRGGIFGLIGSSVLVTEARRLMAGRGDLSNHSDDLRERAELEAKTIDTGWALWTKQVEKRRRMEGLDGTFTPSESSSSSGAVARVWVGANGEPLLSAEESARLREWRRLVQ